MENESTDEMITELSVKSFPHKSICTGGKAVAKQLHRPPRHGGSAQHLAKLEQFGNWTPERRLEPRI